MPLKKKEIETNPSSAYALPSLMTALAAPHIELAVSALLPAPSEWNFFSALPDGKFLELCDSISAHGLIHPLLVWETPEGDKIILSGHNRVKALNCLYEATGEIKYSTAPCVVRRDLDEDEARALVIDANWVQRALSPSEKARCVARRYSEHGRLTRGAGGRAYDQVAEHFGLKATQVYNYVRIAKLPSEILELVDGGKISLKAAAALAKLTPERIAALQEMLGEDFDTAHILEKLNEKPYETLTFTVPRELADAVRLVVDELLGKKFTG